MSAQHYDVLIVGGGNAGMGVTVPIRAAGLSVAMVEARDLGAGARRRRPYRSAGSRTWGGDQSPQQ